MLKLAEKRKVEIRKANGYYGAQLQDFGEKRARALIRAGMRHFKIDRKSLREAPKGDWRKALIAAMIQNETTMRLDWISERLEMGTRAGCCRLAAQSRRQLEKDSELRKHRDAIKRISILNG